MHIVDEYCSDEPFYPTPKFTSQPKSSRQFYNRDTKKDKIWFSDNSKLGVDFAIYKRVGCGGCCSGCGSYGHVLRDLDAMTALCEVRTQDFINLKSQLEKQITLNKQVELNI
ncbi:TPA: hypothetical protein I8034_000493 [Legionella pneumophila]|nr:hypothetical protein [Legionella pneumophila subsp. fraseri]HAT1771155.1 hypothetical protein [Legionella pneumophila]MDX1846914.1 hypothetical protein [Legionella pneumophila subsp. fraseri]HAT1883782.1 hypothetical protein [Legionella pneumophila]HAT2115428.1 hypothetical protein [Legionella pneumophila]